MKSFLRSTFACASLLVVGQQSASAGEVSQQEVIIQDYYWLDQWTAVGNISAVRDSADSVQYLTCLTNGTTITCSAKNAAGANFSCSINATLSPANYPIWLQMVLSIRSSTLLGFACTQSTNQIISITVRQGSTGLP
jgi:hypothetical protein